MIEPLSWQKRQPFDDCQMLRPGILMSRSQLLGRMPLLLQPMLDQVTCLVAFLSCGWMVDGEVIRCEQQCCGDDDDEGDVAVGDGEDYGDDGVRMLMRRETCWMRVVLRRRH